MNTRESFIAGSEDGEVVESGSAGDSLLMEVILSHSDTGRFTRIIVNRLWHRLMGRSIVHAVDAMDTEPWNEDILDHLAVCFAADGHDLKKALAYIVSSQIYQSTTVITGKNDDAKLFRGPLA